MPGILCGFWDWIRLYLLAEKALHRLSYSHPTPHQIVNLMYQTIIPKMLVGYGFCVISSGICYLLRDEETVAMSVTMEQLKGRQAVKQATPALLVPVNGFHSPSEMQTFTVLGFWWQAEWEYAKFLCRLVPTLSRTKWVPLENSHFICFGGDFPSHAKRRLSFWPCS